MSEMQTIPYGDRAILVGDKIVYFCDRVLLISDYPDMAELMADIDRIYKGYQAQLVGEAAELYRQYLEALAKTKTNGN